MGLQSWIVASLAAFDLAILTAFYFRLRSYPRLDNRTLTCIGSGLAGFVFQAFLFSAGAILILQLATIAALFGLCWLQSLGRLSKPKAKAVVDEL